MRKINYPKTRKPTLSRRRYKPCKHCGTIFFGHDRVCCSPECAKAVLAESRATRTFTPAMREAQDRSPLTRRGSPEHHTAKSWSLRDPRGKVWEARNLSEFVRSHPDLFLPEDAHWKGKLCRAFSGLSQLHPGRKLREPIGSWKGWTWAG